MKRIIILSLIIFGMLITPVSAGEKKGDDITLPNIFIWHLPEDESVLKDEINDKAITAKDSEDEITLKIQPAEIPMKGYAEFEETADTIYLQDEHNNLVLNLRVPQKLESKNLIDNKKFKQYKAYSNFNSEEYRIAPQSLMAVEKHGNLSYGTLFDSSIDTSQLERSTTLFTRYEKNKFAISSAYKRNNLTAYGLNTDTLYFAPELRLNKMFSISEVLSADLTRNRKKGEFVLSVNPLKNERMLFELGAGQTFDVDNALIRSQFRFSTKFKL